MSGLISRLKRKGVITDDDELEKDKKKVNLRETENSLPTASDFRDDLESAGSSNDRRKKSYFGKGNIDLNNRKVLKNRDGSISTEQSISFGDDDGNEILVPTIINGKKVSNREAIKHYYKTGENLGIFKSVEEADKYAQKLHNRQNRYYNSTQKTTREDDSDNWFQEKNKDKKLRRVSIENVLPTKNDLIRSVAKTAIEDGKNSDSFLTRAAANLAGVGVDAGLTLRNTIENTIEAAPSSWQWANRKAKEIEKGSSNSKVQEFLMRNYELNNYLNQGSNQYDNINKEKQKALDDLVNNGTGLAKLSEEQKANLKEEIQNILNKHENISMNNSDANTRGEQLDEISKAIEKYMGLEYYDKVVDNTQKAVDLIESEKQKNIEYATSNLGKEAVDVLGNGLGSVLTAAVPVVGQAGLFASSSQQYYNEAKQRGMNDEKASAFGDIMGIVEAGTEGINIGNIKKVWNSFKTLGKSGAKEIIKSAAEQGAKTETLELLNNLNTGSLKNVIKNLAISSGENYAQEFATEYIQEGVATAIDNKGQWDGILKRANESGVTGALTALIPGLAGSVINIGNGRTSQLETFISDMSNGKISEEQFNMVAKDIAKNSNSNIEDVKEILKASADAYTEINNQKSKENILPVANKENTNSNKLKEIARQEITNSNLSADEKGQMISALNSLNNVTEADMESIRNTIENTTETKLINTISNNNFEYIPSNNIKIDNIRKDASKYLDNSKKSNNLISSIENIIADKDYNIRLTDDITDTNGNVAGGSITKQDGETIINLNVNSDKAIEFLVTHEVGHAIATNELKTMINDFASKNEDFSTAVESLKKTYDTTEITDEVASDIMGQYLGNQEFLNSLSTQKPSIFKRMYDAIISLANKITGNSNEALFIKDLKNKFQKAYRESEQSNIQEGKTNYYIEPIAKFNNVEYNNLIEERLGSKEYQILRRIINSDSNIKPGINYVEVTNGRYTVYYKGFDEFKVMSKEVDLDAGRINERNDSSRREKRYSETLEQSIGDKRTTTSDDEVSNINTQGTRERGGSNTSSSTNIQDIKYSKNNKDWQSYLEDNFESKGTKTYFDEIRNSEKSSINLSEKVNKQEDVGNKLSKYRSDEQISKDKSISDLDAIRESSKKVETPNLLTMEKVEKNLNNNGIYKSPTIDYISRKRSKEKLTAKEIKDTLAQRFVNKGHYIDKLAKQTGNKNLTFLYDRTMNTFNEAQISIGDNQVNSKGEVVGKSLIDVFKPSVDSGLDLKFEDYLLNRHNISRYAYEKGLYGNEISAADSSEIVSKYEEKYPQFKKWAKDVYKYNDNNLKDLVSNGMISQNLYDKLKDLYGDYVPTFRDITNNISEYIDDTVGSNPIKKATQSDKSILSVKESIAEQTLMQKKAIRMNNLGIELYKTLGKDSTILDGIKVDPVAMQTLSGDVIEKAADGSNVFTIFKDGEMIQFKISDELYSAFSKDTVQNRINNNKTIKALLTPVEKISKAQRELLTTYSVGFALNNPIKDVQDAVFNSKYGGLTFAKNYTKALYNIGTDGSWYQSFKNNGGTANTYFDYSKGLLPTNSKNPIKKFANKIKDINEVLEQAPRLAEYISTIENKGSVDEALYNAAEITTNFKRGGDITKAANKYGTNFLNASVQGLDKVYRNITGQNGIKGYANLLTKAALYQIVPAIVNGLVFKDDKDYEDLQEYTKDNYYLFKMGDGKFFRIPKGRVSAVVGGIARRSLETVEGKNVDWKSIVDTTINQLAPNNPLTDNVVAPLVQAKNNKSWFGGDIVNTRLQKLPVAEQFDESTDKLSKWLGEKLNLSPKKINYVLDQYSGGIGDVLLPKLTPQAENNILEDKFTTDAVMKNKNVSKFYSELQELEIQNNSSKATDEDKLKYQYISNVSKTMSDFYKQKREIQNSSISDKEKNEKVRDVQKQINELAEGTLKGLEDDIKIKGNTADLSGTQYYKQNGTWKMLSDKDNEKTQNINLTAFSDYKNKLYDLSQKKKQDEESIKAADKIQILLNSKYSNKDKEELYKNYIGTSDKLYDIMKNTGIDIDEYLKYKTQEFEANKKDNGTTKGKTVSGSRKKKVYNYINNMNITYQQKLVLLGTEYKLSSSKERTDLATYVNDLDLSKKEKMKIYEKLKGFTVYKNGNIKW